MFRRRRSEHTTHHHNTTRRGLFDFMRKPAFQIGLVVVAVFIVIWLVLTGQPSAATRMQPTATAVSGEISVNEAYKLYQSKAVYFLDVRERSEWDQYHIPGTTLLPLGQVAGLADKFPKDKPIVVVCSTGVRSKEGRDILKQAGYANAMSMIGGVEAWKAKGYPIEP